MMFAVCYIIFNIIKESCSKVSSEVAASVAGSCMVMSFISGSGQQRAAVGSSGQVESHMIYSAEAPADCESCQAV